MDKITASPVVLINVFSQKNGNIFPTSATNLLHKLALIIERVQEAVETAAQGGVKETRYFALLFLPVKKSQTWPQCRAHTSHKGMEGGTWWEPSCVRKAGSCPPPLSLVMPWVNQTHSLGSITSAQESWARETRCDGNRCGSTRWEQSCCPEAGGWLDSVLCSQRAQGGSRAEPQGWAEPLPALGKPCSQPSLICPQHCCSAAFRQKSQLL